MDKYILFGQIHSTHGLKGEVCIECFFENYEFFINKNYLNMENNGIIMPVKAILTGRKKGNLIISIEGYETIESAILLLKKEIFILRSVMEELPKTKGDYYVCDIIGLAVIMDNISEKYGIIEDVVDFGGGTLLEVKINALHPKNIGKKEEIEYFEKKSIKEVDLSKGLVSIKVEE